MRVGIYNAGMPLPTPAVLAPTGLIQFHFERECLNTDSYLPGLQ
jgi:hypothetical protein